MATMEDMIGEKVEWMKIWNLFDVSF